MEENYIPYGCQDINEEDINAVLGVLKDPFLTQGPKVKEFEEAISKKVGSYYAVSTNSATSALHIACLALGIQKGDIVWTSPITFVASANCGLYCRADVDFVDIDPQTGLICTSELEKKLEIAKKQNKLPKVLIPVHLTGSSCDMKKINSLSRKYGFYIIEDASHALGGKYHSEYVGNCKYSDITVFSFHPVKIITTGEGGMATTNNKDLSQKMKDYTTHGITKDLNRFVNPAAGLWSYEQQKLGFNYRLTDIQASLGISQLKRLDNFVNKRNQIRHFYMENLKNLPLKIISIPDSVYSACHLVVIRLINKSKSGHKMIFENLRNSGVGVQLHYSAVHLQPYYKKLGFKFGDFPEAEAYSHDAISLPVYTKLTIEKQHRVVSLLKKTLFKFN